MSPSQYSTPKRRPKSDPKTPISTSKPYKYNRDQSPSHSSSSTVTSIFGKVEPTPDLLPSSQSEFLRLLLVLAIAALVAASCHFLVGVFHRPTLPFCDYNGNLDSGDVLFSESCEPCPSNGRCYKGQLECIQGYRKYGKMCIEDGDISETANKLAEWAKDHLCEAHAQHICHGTGTIWVSEDDLNSMLDSNGLVQSSTLDDVKIMYVKKRARQYIDKLLETRTTDDGIKEFKCPEILADSYKPVTCRGRQWIAKNLVFIIPISALLAGCTLLVFRIRRRWYLTNRAEQLYHQVCDILEENALVSKSTMDGEPWLVASRLRDHLLSPMERKDSRLWKMVEELVELDSRVDRYPKLVKGESKVVWEWQVEGSLSSRRQQRREVKGNLAQI